MTDVYEFAKSCFPQNIEDETPYASKQWNYINDINSGVYSNQGSTLVQIDMSSIFNSQALIDASQLFLTIPICLVSAYISSNTSGTLVAPNAGSWATHGLKNGYFQMLHAADIIVDSQTLEQFCPNLNSYINFKMLSQMSQDDLKSLGSSLGMGEVLDNYESLRFNSQSNIASQGTGAYPAQLPAATTGLSGGNGLVNNSAFANSGSYISVLTSQGSWSSGATAVTLASSAAGVVQVGQLVTGLGIETNTYVSAFDGTTGVTLSQNTYGAGATKVAITFSTFVTTSGDQSSQGIQFQGSSNNGYYSRLKKYIDASSTSSTTGGSFQNLYGSSSSGVGVNASNIMSISQLNNEFKPYYTVSSNYMITYDLAIIRLQDVFDSMKQMPLVKKFNGVLRLYMNCGAVGSVIRTSLNGTQMITSANSSTFTNTCPLIQSSMPNIPSSATGLVSGLFVSKAPTTNIFGVNLASSAAAHPMTACRIYYNQVILKPEKLRDYISENQNKKICYTSVLYNQFNAISSGATFSALVQSGVSNIRGVLIIPFISASINGSCTGYTGITTFSQNLSPFDTAPSTTGPLSLTNLQCSVGGVNQLSTVLNYSFENFLEQVSIYEKINAGDLGLSCGLINEAYWSTAYRCYYVDCSRGNNSDLGVLRNLNVTFNNNTNVTIDVMIFTEYFNQIEVNVESGRIKK